MPESKVVPAATCGGMRVGARDARSADKCGGSIGEHRKVTEMSRLLATPDCGNHDTGARKNAQRIYDAHLSLPSGLNIS